MSHKLDKLGIPNSKPYIDEELYKQWYDLSINNPDEFWGELGRRHLTWRKEFTSVKDVSYQKNDLHISWFGDGRLNVCENCVDRHLETKADQIAIIWEADDPDTSIKITYKELHFHVCRLANVLENRGVKKGDRVTIYMPMILEAAYAMLACSRIGAIHSVVFGGFSPGALAGRIENSESDFIITADGGIRGGKHIAIKDNVDKALLNNNKVRHVLVVKHTQQKISMKKGRDLWYEQEVSEASSNHQAKSMSSKDPFFILYTSGSTGKPKGVLHSYGGYLLYASVTHKYVLDYHEGDIYWCTADVGWITGHSYIVYGPLANGATTLMFEGVAHYPDVSRFWQIIDKHKVSIFYTAPTAIRALMRDGEEPVNKTSRKSLRLLGTVGEPINPEAWNWYHKVVGNGKSPIVDTWWQTETGGILITPLPSSSNVKPGSATQPFFGIKPIIVDKEGNTLEGEATGVLCIADSWPGQMTSVYGDHDRFYDTYFSTFKGKYFTGDGARRDADGDYWITGRVDDVLNISGHRMGTAEIESAIVEHTSVAEAAVVGYPHDIKGQGIYCFVTLKRGIEESNDLADELKAKVREILGPIVTPDLIQWAPGLPKTRSGKIMRRILRKIAADDFQNLGDISTLADPSVVESLINNRLNKYEKA